MCAKLMERSHVTNTCRVRTFNLERVFEHADRTHAPLPFCCQIQVKHLWSALRLVWCLQTDDNMSSKQKRESQRVDRRVFSVGRPSSRRQQVPDLGNVHAACHRHDLPGCSLGRCFQHWARSSEDFSTAGPLWGFMNSAQQTRYVARSAVSGKLWTRYITITRFTICFSVQKQNLHVAQGLPVWPHTHTLSLLG